MANSPKAGSHVWEFLIQYTCSIAYWEICECIWECSGATLIACFSVPTNQKSGRRTVCKGKTKIEPVAVSLFSSNIKYVPLKLLILDWAIVRRLVMLTSASMDEIPWCYHSNETSSAVLSLGTIHSVCRCNFWVYGRDSMVLPFKRHLLGRRFAWYNLS